MSDGINDGKETMELHDALLEFELACPLPTMDDVREWQARYPAYERQILDHAAEVAEDALSGSALQEAKFDKRDEPYVARALEAAVAARGMARPKALADVARASGRSTEEVADAVGLPARIVADVLSGAIFGDLPKRLVERLASFLPEMGGLGPMVGAASLGHASASGAPIRGTRTFAQAVEESDMSPERKAYWLDAD